MESYLASVLQDMGPDPTPPIALSYIKSINKEWVNGKTHQNWVYNHKYIHTKFFAKHYALFVNNY